MHLVFAEIVVYGIIDRPATNQAWGLRYSVQNLGEVTLGDGGLDVGVHVGLDAILVVEFLEFLPVVHHHLSLLEWLLNPPSRDR